jgi:polyisoprenoid-binding protein YceI
MFDIDFLKFSQVSGRFEKMQGSLELNQESQQVKNVSLKIATYSIFTGNKIRDDHLRKNDFFGVKKYPYILFTADDFQLVYNQWIKVKGLLSIKKFQKPVMLEIKVSPPIKDTWKYPSLFVEVKTKINRKEFGLDWNKTIAGKDFLIGDLVSVRANIQFQQLGVATPMAKYKIPDTRQIRQREKVGRGEMGKEQLKVDQKAQPEPIATKQMKRPEKAATASVNRVQHKSLIQHLSYYYIAFMGLLACIYLSLKMKLWLSEKLKEKYQETGTWGIISDLVSMIFIYVYVIAFYYLEG